MVLFPLGESMATQLTVPAFLFGEGEQISANFTWDNYWVYIFAAAIGFSTTVAEAIHIVRDKEVKALIVKKRDDNDEFGLVSYNSIVMYGMLAD